jgi:hypothetical protein
MGQFRTELPWPSFTRAIVEILCAFGCRGMLDAFELGCRTPDQRAVALIANSPFGNSPNAAVAGSDFSLFFARRVCLFTVVAVTAIPSRTRD